MGPTQVDGVLIPSSARRDRRTASDPYQVSPEILDLRRILANKPGWNRELLRRLRQGAARTRAEPITRVERIGRANRS